jgi:hypothetical protein
MRHSHYFRDHGLSIVLVVLFLGFWIAQIYTGWRVEIEEQLQHGEPAPALTEYLTSGHFIEATGENWESEFLQMAAYVLLTVGLFQRGSSESKDPDEEEEVDRDPRESRQKPDIPWPVRKGGVILVLYEYSLSIVFFLLFLGSLALHAVGGAELYNEERVAHGEPTVGLGDYLSSSTFWFESFQNWQSEFLALLAMVLLSIHLRQRGSPESKPVDAPHSQTGSE